MGSSVVGTQSEYTAACLAEGLSVPNNDWPQNSCTGGGATFNSSGSACSPHTTAADFFYNQVVPAFPSATYDNILILHGNQANCWAHNAEAGSMFAFGGPSGSGYSFCRGGGTAAKQFHIYVCN